jgi:hypothetical protein
MILFFFSSICNLTNCDKKNYQSWILLLENLNIVLIRVGQMTEANITLGLPLTEVRVEDQDTLQLLNESV